MTAKTVAKVLGNKVISSIGVSLEISYDQGKNFYPKLVEESLL